MVGFLLIILIFGGLAIIFHLLAKVCFAADRYIQERNDETSYHRRALEQSVLHIEQSVAVEEKKESYTQRLIEANRAVLEKKQLNKAMSEELGIPE